MFAVCSESVEDVGDLYLDVAEAYMEQGNYTECKPILAALVDSQKYNLVRECFPSYCLPPPPPHPHRTRDVS